MKVRQAIPVTSELGDTSNLARFDGECLPPVLCGGAAPGFPPPSLVWVPPGETRTIHAVLWPCGMKRIAGERGLVLGALGWSWPHGGV